MSTQEDDKKPDQDAPPPPPTPKLDPEDLYDVSRGDKRENEKKEGTGTKEER